MLNHVPHLLLAIKNSKNENCDKMGMDWIKKMGLGLSHLLPEPAAAYILK